MNKEELERYVKNSINNCFKKMAEEPEEFFDNYKLQKKYNKVIKENANLKQALNEIRECCEDNAIEVNTKEYGNLVVTNIDDILQIIDKAIGDDNN